MNNKTPIIPGTVIIAHDIHATSQDGLDRALDFLAADYDIKDCMKDEYHPHSGYFATLKESVFQNLTKCDFCGHLNTQLACKVHGYSCKNCGKVLYKEYVKGGTIRFSFRNDESMKYVTLYIHSYENDRIICYPKPAKTEAYFSAKNPVQHLEQFKDEYEVVTVDGKRMLSFFYPAKWKKVDRTINMAEVRGAPNTKRQHYRSVCVYKGEVFEDRYELGVKDSFMIYDTFKYAPFKDTGRLHAKIMSMAGQVSRCDYYYQDRRPSFNDTQLGWMKTAVETFTDLPKEEFAYFLQTCRKDGPGFICQLAQFVEKHTKVKQYLENHPDVQEILKEKKVCSYYDIDGVDFIFKMGEIISKKGRN